MKKNRHEQLEDELKEHYRLHSLEYKDKQKYDLKELAKEAGGIDRSRLPPTIAMIEFKNSEQFARDLESFLLFVDWGNEKDKKR
jgi:hypothetical protein